MYVAELIDRAANIVALAKTKATTKKLKDFFEICAKDDKVCQEIGKLRSEVNEYALKYPMPGFEDH